jgi:hypothetical protein
MRRAAVSVASNIAEGKGKSSDGEFILFLCHARGSLHELETQTLIAEQLGYLQNAAAERIETLTLETGNGLIQFLGRDVRKNEPAGGSGRLRQPTSHCFYASNSEASGNRNLCLANALDSKSSTCRSSQFFAIVSSLTSR